VQWLQAAGASEMIHGHTHRPATHALGEGLRRHVLSDWDFEAQPARGDLLRLRHAGLRRIQFA
jgi:UDP-2,3-diacylglucosamine hydrolase